MPKTITVDGIEYVPKTESKLLATRDGLEYCIVRTYSAGVFAGYVGKLEGKAATVLDARRLWYWAGAASLSQLAKEGVKKPDECKFPCEVERVYLTEVVEVIPCTENARKNISNVPVWEE